jgi:hypothetical protein
VTARWVVDAVSPERDLDITWKPISLFFKNEPAEDSEYYGPTFRTHRLLRVFMSVQDKNGNDAAFRLYWELGSRIHHDGDLEFTAEAALASAGLDAAHAAALDDESWDRAIREGMDDGLALAGQDVGTPSSCGPGRRWRSGCSSIPSKPAPGPKGGRRVLRGR